MIKLHTCLRCSHQWPSKLEVPITCSKCRSPYWRIPKGESSPSNIPVADFPVEKKPAEASPEVKKEPYTFTELVEKRLHPERTDEQRKQEIDNLKSLMDMSSKKGNESVLPVYPPNVDEYGPVLNYD